MSRPPFHLRVLATDDVFFEGAAKSVVFPGLDGYAGILAGHAPMISAIGAGPLKISPAEGAEIFLFVADGFVRVVDYMGTDNAIVQAARVSYGSGTKKAREDRALIRYRSLHP